jgi:hypothetical protein
MLTLWLNPGAGCLPPGPAGHIIPPGPARMEGSLRSRALQVASELVAHGGEQLLRKLPFSA